MMEQKKAALKLKQQLEEEEDKSIFD